MNMRHKAEKRRSLGSRREACRYMCQGTNNVANRPHRAGRRAGQHEQRADGCQDRDGGDGIGNEVPCGRGCFGRHRHFISILLAEGTGDDDQQPAELIGIGLQLIGEELRVLLGGLVGFIESDDTGSSAARFSAPACFGSFAEQPFRLSWPGRESDRSASRISSSSVTTSAPRAILRSRPRFICSMRRSSVAVSLPSSAFISAWVSLCRIHSPGSPVSFITANIRKTEKRKISERRDEPRPLLGDVAPGELAGSEHQLGKL